MPPARRFTPTFLLIVLLAGCGGADAPPPEGEPLATLKGRAVLPADTFFPEPFPVGAHLDRKINGRDLPFDRVPVQGFSSLVPEEDGVMLVLQDNGFGTMVNSPDYPLRWFRLRPDFTSRDPAGGAVEVLGHTDWSDPGRLFTFRLARPDSGRFLTGADLDPESFVVMDDGSCWVGEEFGPSLVHLGADGVVLNKPASVPVVPPLRDFARGSPFLRTPDHPDLRFLSREQTRDALANLPRSGGLEGLARNETGSLLYAAVEKPMLDDPERRRRVILEFSPDRHGFTGRFWLYHADGANVSLASLEWVHDGVLLVLERDTGEGREAGIKRIYRVRLGQVDAEGYLVKNLVCDLLNIDDSAGLTRSERGAVRLGNPYGFPYVTPECLAVIDARTLLVANDNNYPMSAGRRPPDTPDDNEIILLDLHEPLWDEGGAP
jgi:glycerophosphoryl diester phosphodiesterase